MYLLMMTIFTTRLRLLFYRVIRQDMQYIFMVADSVTRALKVSWRDEVAQRS